MMKGGDHKKASYIMSFKPGVSNQDTIDRSALDCILIAYGNLLVRTVINIVQRPVDLVKLRAAIIREWFKMLLLR